MAGLLMCKRVVMAAALSGLDMIGRHGADCFGRERMQDGRCHPGGDALLSRPPLVPAADANANGNGNASASASASASWPAGRVGGQSAAQHRAGGASGRVCSGVGRSIVRCGVHARANHSTCQIFRQQARAALSPHRPSGHAHVAVSEGKVCGEQQAVIAIAPSVLGRAPASSPHA